MNEAIRIYLPWLMSAVTIYMTLMAGNKAPWAWAVGLGKHMGSITRSRPCNKPIILPIR